jgi:hypothetical protein
MEFYSATKNEILSLTGTRMELENIILSEVSQAQRLKAMFSLICGILTQYKYRNIMKNRSY